MRKALRVLFIEDEEHAVELLLLELARGGYAVTHERVDTVETLGAAIERSAWDVILSDYSMPKLTAPLALALVKERRLDVPFIIVSGTVDEVTAVASMRAGAHDFITKDKLARLLPAIARELEDATVRSERARMAEQLLLSERLASLGTLAAGVAHEINNPLAAMLANLEVVVGELRAALSDYGVARSAPGTERMIAAGERLAASVTTSMPALDDAREATARIREVSADLKAFSWRDADLRVAIDVTRILESSLRLAHTEIRHRARVVRAYEPVPPVAATETRLGQVFLNLLINAAHAIPEGDASRHEIRVATKLAADGRVVVEVHDSGPGIPSDVLPHIFDAFFTTKPRGVGSGLGLAISHRVVTELGGEIEVETGATTGTTFRITLLAATTAEVAVPSAVAAAASPRRGKVLIIDDDELVLNASRRLLASAHDVSITTNPREALARLVGGEQFDVLLCDLLMPDLSGMALHHELAQRRPEQAARMLFMSGGAFTEEARQFLKTTHQPCIEKPFTAAGLRELVNRILA